METKIWGSLRSIIPGASAMTYVDE